MTPEQSDGHSASSVFDRFSTSSRPVLDRFSTGIGQRFFHTCDNITLRYRDNCSRRITRYGTCRHRITSPERTDTSDSDARRRDLGSAYRSGGLW